MIGVIGLGFVGGSVHKFFTERGEQVLGFDIKSNPLNETVNKCGMVFVCVPTPTVGGDQDISALHDVLDTLDEFNYHGIVVIKSTVLPHHLTMFQDCGWSKLVYNPEFLTEANAYGDFCSQPAILIGGYPTHTSIVACLYAKHFPTSNIIETTVVEACLAKYMHNCFLASKVAWCNQFAELCNRLGANYSHVRDMACTQGKILVNHTNVPGKDGKRGYSLSCFPKDTRALATLARKLGTPLTILESAMSYNESIRPHDLNCREIVK